MLSLAACLETIPAPAVKPTVPRMPAKTLSVRESWAECMHTEFDDDMDGSPRAHFPDVNFDPFCGGFMGDEPMDPEHDRDMGAPPRAYFPGMPSDPFSRGFIGDDPDPSSETVGSDNGEEPEPGATGDNRDDVELIKARLQHATKADLLYRRSIDAFIGFSPTAYPKRGDSLETKIKFLQRQISISPEAPLAADATFPFLDSALADPQARGLPDAPIPDLQRRLETSVQTALPDDFSTDNRLQALLGLRLRFSVTEPWFQSRSTNDQKLAVLAHIGRSFTASRPRRRLLDRLEQATVADLTERAAASFLGIMIPAGACKHGNMDKRKTVLQAHVRAAHPPDAAELDGMLDHALSHELSNAKACREYLKLNVPAFPTGKPTHEEKVRLLKVASTRYARPPAVGPARRPPRASSARFGSHFAVSGRAAGIVWEGSLRQRRPLARCPITVCIACGSCRATLKSW